MAMQKAPIEEMEARADRDSRKFTEQSDYKLSNRYVSFYFLLYLNVVYIYKMVLYTYGVPYIL